MPRLRQDEMPDRYDDKSRGPRLQRILADAGVAARRVCEQMILNGDVEVNGRLVAKLPAFANPDIDHIVVQGRPIKRRSRKIYVMLNKPTNTITTTADEPDMDRRTVSDLVDHPTADRLFPVGRLDFDTTGLILMTNDGELANKLTHPRFGVVKTYHAVVKGKLSDEDADQIAEGIYLAERKAGRTDGASRTARVEVKVFHRDRDKTVLELKLREGRNRQVRRMLASVGCPVKKLERVAMGPVKLKGLPRGGWRELSKGELDGLRKAVARGKGEPEMVRKKATKKTKKKVSKKTSSKRSYREEEAPVSIVDKKRIKSAVARSGKKSIKQTGARRYDSGTGR